MKLKYLFLTTIASMLGLFTIGQPDSARAVLAEPKPCSTYEIEGTMDPKVEPSAQAVITTPDTTTDKTAVQRANVYLHLGDKPLVGHQVFATFAGSMNETLGEPVLLVTDEYGSATVEVPQGVVQVAFMTESPGSGNCSVSSESMNEPSVVAVTIPVQPTFDGPIGRDTGTTYDDISSPISGSQGGVNIETGDLQLASKAVDPTGELAHTGPISSGILVLTVVALGVGCGLGLGRGRRGSWGRE